MLSVSKADHKLVGTGIGSKAPHVLRATLATLATDLHQTPFSAHAWVQTLNFRAELCRSTGFWITPCDTQRTNSREQYVELVPNESRLLDLHEHFRLACTTD